MILVDEIKERMTTERIVSAVLRQPELASVDEALDRFDRQLVQPLNFEAMKAAVLREVS